MGIKRVAIVLNTSWNLYNFRLNLAKAIQKAGFEVIFIAPFDSYSQKLKDEGFEYYDIKINNKGTNPIEDIKTTIAFYKLYKKLSLDIILHYTIKPNIYGTIASNLLNIPTINNISGLGTLFIKESLSTKIAKMLYRYSQSKANRVFFQNRDDLELFIKNRLVDKNRCDLLSGSGVDLTKFTPIEKKSSKVFKFLLIARMIRDKGVIEYVESAKILKNPNIEFLLLGATDIQNVTAISKEQIKIWEEEKIIKYINHSDNVKEIIAKVDCVVLPSYREGTPRTLLEASAMAKPIITTNTVGCKEVVDDGVNGYLCEVKNSKDLAKKMQMMLNLSQEERAKMGQKGREKMEKEFDERFVIEKYLDVISLSTTPFQP